MYGEVNENNENSFKLYTDIPVSKKILNYYKIIVQNASP